MSSLKESEHKDKSGFIERLSWHWIWTGAIFMLFIASIVLIKVIDYPVDTLNNISSMVLFVFAVSLYISIIATRNKGGVAKKPLPPKVNTWNNNNKQVSNKNKIADSLISFSNVLISIGVISAIILIIATMKTEEVYFIFIAIGVILSSLFSSYILKGLAAIITYLKIIADNSVEK